MLSDKDIKYTLNSIISATDINKLSDEDKGDIINKIEDKDEEGSEEAPIEPMGENDDMMMGNEQDNTIARFSASGGQTVGEVDSNTINEHILSILEKAKQNVKNNLNKI